MLAFFGVIASLLTVGHFFIGQLLRPEDRIPRDHRSSIILVIFTSSMMFWTLYGLLSGIYPIAISFATILLYCIVILVIKTKRNLLPPPDLRVKPKTPYASKPRFYDSEKR